MRVTLTTSLLVLENNIYLWISYRSLYHLSFLLYLFTSHTLLSFLIPKSCPVFTALFSCFSRFSSHTFYLLLHPIHLTFSCSVSGLLGTRASELPESCGRAPPGLPSPSERGFSRFLLQGQALPHTATSFSWLSLSSDRAQLRWLAYRAFSLHPGLRWMFMQCLLISCREDMCLILHRGQAYIIISITLNAVWIYANF